MKMTVRCDWYVYTVLSCLPWVGKELHEKKDVEMDRLLNQIEGYLKYVRPALLALSLLDRGMVHTLDQRQQMIWHPKSSLTVLTLHWTLSNLDSVPLHSFSRLW
ncbi:hypothetical protein COCON_G00108780, partial [Conger conger]